MTRPQPGSMGISHVAARPPSTVHRLLPAHGGASLVEHHDRLGSPPHLSAAETVQMLDGAGLLGRGGAAFPTARKVAAVAKAVAKTRVPAVVVANCCEGDPTSVKDAVLIDRSPHLVIDGAVAAAAAVGADRIVLAVHQGSSAQRTLRWALAERPSSEVPLELVAIPARYLASEATALVRFLNTGDARPAGRLPIWEKGVEGRPTLVDNAETLAQLSLITRFGSAWFAAIGSPAEPGTALITVGGAVPRPGVLEVPTNAAIREVLTLAGSASVGWALIGGLAGRWVNLAGVAGIGISAAELQAAAGATRGVGSITVLPAGACVLTETVRIVQHQAGAGARQCGPCMFGLPAIADDLAGLARGDRTALDRLRRRLPTINGRGACGHPDGTVALAASALNSITAHEPGHLERHLSGHQCATSAAVPLRSIPTPAIAGRRHRGMS